MNAKLNWDGMENEKEMERNGKQISMKWRAQSGKQNRKWKIGRQIGIETERKWKEQSGMQNG